MTLARSSFSLSTWCARLFVGLLLGAISGCYVPVSNYDFSGLSDNVVDASIKKHFRPYSRVGEPSLEDDLRADFLEVFPPGSPAEATVSYLASIGGQCHVESQQEKSKTDRCVYERQWKRYSQHLLSRKWRGDVTGVIDYVVLSSDGKVEDVIVELNMKSINRAADR